MELDILELKKYQALTNFIGTLLRKNSIVFFFRLEQEQNLAMTAMERLAKCSVTS